ncbi:gliding motility protein [Streptomyces sp. 8K308]|uniref:gliding motility protein n=1 Tax=Streptomyces sp. 8K308 TaxID=2530388 RepID=UPI001052D0A4|nr:gliding motility protein [Streptomyces sp. 8K308]TDC27853.1 gliding motility protein [Streptomyces sp. 8K308]
MGVFSWLRRRAAEGEPPAGEGAEAADTGAAAESVGIPKQTAAAEAADSEAGEGART